MAKKCISLLTAEETINELEKPPEELRKTPYTRGGLCAHLAHLATKANMSGDYRTETKASGYLVHLKNHGSDMDKAEVTRYLLKEV
jgi:hypothetical protein